MSQPDTKAREPKKTEEPQKMKWHDSWINRLLVGAIAFWFFSAFVIPLGSFLITSAGSVKGDEIAQEYGLVPRGGDAYYVTPVADGSYRSLSEQFATPERIYEHSAVLLAQEGEEYHLFAEEEDGTLSALDPKDYGDWGVELETGENPAHLVNDAYDITIKRTFSSTDFGVGGWMSSDAIKDNRIIETVVMWNSGRIGVFERDGNELTELSKAD